jgi:ATP-dependent DNA helicase Q1
MTSTKEQINYALKRVYKFDAFRGVQEQAITRILDFPNRDAFILMPTGGGKSLCYCIPAILSIGLSIVISPLLSLIQDQVISLVSTYDIPAACLSSESTEAEVQRVYTELSKFPTKQNNATVNRPNLKILFITPEKLVLSESFQRILSQLYNFKLLSRIVIDECHCVSTWGHDFREQYKALGMIRTLFPSVQIVALTATATKLVKDDVISILRMRDPMVFTQDVNRPNLFYSVRPKIGSEVDHYRMILTYIKEEHSPDDCGIIYCLSRDNCEELALFLQQEGIVCDFYHAGMQANHRTLVQTNWQLGKIKLVIATIAYGMGIDKSNVRFVVHETIPKSIEGLYQESGRAGRDGLPSHCLVFYSPSDVIRVKRLIKMNLRNTKIMQEQEKKLAEVVEYVYSSECRRAFFSKYFDDRSSSIVPLFTSDISSRDPINCESCGTCAKQYRQNNSLSIDSLIGVKNEKLNLNLLSQHVNWLREFDPRLKKTVFEFEKAEKKTKASMKSAIVSTEKDIQELKEKRAKGSRNFSWKKKFRRRKT